jgi:MFS family permease
MRPRPAADPREVHLGLSRNLGQFLLLVSAGALVGATTGQERAIVPLLATRIFGLEEAATAVAFVAAFGLTKAGANLVAATLCDRIGRKPVMIAGWLVGLPVPLLLIWAPTWTWVIAANALLGVHDGLTSSAIVIMKIDLVGPRRRGFAMGVTEGVGYLGVAVAAFAAGLVASRYGLRPEPFFLGVAYAALGFGIAAIPLRETHWHARREAAEGTGTWTGLPSTLSLGPVFALTSFRDRALSASVQAGFFNNLNDAVAWGLFPLRFAAEGLSVSTIAALAALYPAVWGIGSFFAGSLSDRFGRKWIVTFGMCIQAAGLALVAGTAGVGSWAVAVSLLGAGTAMAYPTLLAAVGDAAHPEWRASAIGVYRLWRDVGLVVGAIAGGVLADAFGLSEAIWVVAAATALSGALVAIRMYETRGRTVVHAP